MTVSALLIRGLVEVVEAAGIRRSRLFEAARFDPSLLADSQAQFAPAVLWRLDQAAVALSKDPGFGLRVGEGAHESSYDLLGHLTAQAPTLRVAVEALSRFGRMVSTLTRYDLEERATTAILKVSWPPGPPPVADRFRSEAMMAGLHRLIRYYGGIDASIVQVCFRHSEPLYVREYRRIFGGVERFDQPFTGIEFDRRTLDCSQIHRNDALFSMLTTHAEQTLHRASGPIPVAERLVTYLESACFGSKIGMTGAARQLGMSPRTLRRRLSEEGVSFTQLVARARVKVAKQALRDPDRTLYDAALAAGFSDPNAFHRAFKRWTGVTPHQYRTAR